MPRKTTIHLRWDKAGRIKHSYDRVSQAPPRNDSKLWVLAPSAPLFLAHQYGSMKPSHGLIATQRVMDILFYNRYVRMPINNALKSASLDFIYTDGPSVKLQFHPKHRLFANSDSLEEGVRQLLNNYTQYVYSQLDDYTRLVVQLITIGAVGGYFGFLQEQIAQDQVGPDRDRWTMAFPAFSAQTIQILSEAYFVPQGGPTKDNEEWAREQTEDIRDKKTRLESIRQSLFIEMGIN